VKILLIVVHLLDGWGGSALIAPGIDDLDLPRVDLVQSGEGVYSGSGEWAGEDPDIAVVVGLYWRACLMNTLVDLDESRIVLVRTDLVLHSSTETLESHLSHMERVEAMNYLTNSLRAVPGRSLVIWIGKNIVLF
jgi:hypothetical protein